MPTADVTVKNADGNSVLHCLFWNYICYSGTNPRDMVVPVGTKVIQLGGSLCHRGAGGRTPLDLLQGNHVPSNFIEALEQVQPR